MFILLPYEGFGDALAGLVDAEEYEALLGRVLSFVRERGGGCVAQDLFEEVSVHYHDRSLAFLSELAKGADARTLTWIAGLFTAPDEDWLVDRQKSRRQNAARAAVGPPLSSTHIL